MKVYLINAPRIVREGKTDLTVELDEITRLFPPLGILYLAGYLRENVKDVEIKVIDGLIEGLFATFKKVKRFSPDIVGISSTTANSTGAYQLSHLIRRELPNSLIIIGGIYATSMPKDTLKRSAADFVVIAEGEIIFSEVVKTYAKVKSRGKCHYEHIKGLAYLENGVLKQTGLMPLIQNIDDIPFPARDLIDLSLYKRWVLAKKHPPETSIISTRGCPFNCNFCSNIIWKFQKPWLRLRSPGNIMDEVEEMRDRFRYKEYIDQSDEINSSIRWAVQVAQEKIRRKIDMPWKAYIRADLVTNELVKNLAKSGLWYVQIGIESGNNKTLKGIGKNITLAQVVGACKLLKKYKIKIMGLFMFFNLWEKNSKLMYEGVQESRTTLKFIKKLLKENLIDYASMSQSTPYHGSMLWDIALRHRIIKPEHLGRWERWSDVWNSILDLPGVSDSDRTQFFKASLLLKQEIADKDLLQKAE